MHGHCNIHPTKPTVSRETSPGKAPGGWRKSSMTWWRKSTYYFKKGEATDPTIFNLQLRGDRDEERGLPLSAENHEESV